MSWAESNLLLKVVLPPELLPERRDDFDALFRKGRHRAVLVSDVPVTRHEKFDRPLTD